MTTPAAQASKKRGFTMVELMMSLAITALIGLGAASVVFAVARGTDTRVDMHSLVIRHKVIDARLAGLIRSSHMILAQGSNYLVLWVYDTNGNQVPTRDEVRYVEFDANAGQLNSYKTVWTSGMTQSQINTANTEYPLATNFGTVIPALKGQATFPGECWATNITAFSTVLNSTDAQSATLANYTVTFSFPGGTYNVIGAAAMRNWVVNAGGGN